MVGYVKGTDIQHELTVIRGAVAKIGAAMQSDPDATQAFRDATALEQLGSEISKEASDFRGWFAAYLIDGLGIPQNQLARMLGMSPGRLSQLVKAGRQQRTRGNPVMDPGTIPLQPPVVLAVVTSPRGVLVAHRRDERPPWTFPGGDIQAGEAPATAALRRITAETGITATPLTVLGQRVHPRTGRHMVYMAFHAEDGQPEPVTTDDDLDGVEWVGLDTIRARMPDMFDPVRQHLEATLSAANLY